MKKIVDKVIKAKNGDVQAMYDVFMFYQPVIKKNAKMIHDYYHIDTVEELESLGYDGLLDAIEIFNGSNFSGGVEYYVIKKMLKDKYFQIRKIIFETENIFGRKYNPDDADMTKQICESVWEALGEFYPDSDKKKNVINQKFPNILKDLALSKDIHKSLYEKEGIYMPKNYADYKSVEKNDMFFVIKKIVRKLSDVSYDSLRNYSVDIEIPDYKDKKVILDSLGYYFGNYYLILRFCIYPGKKLSDEEICSYLNISMEKLQSIYKKDIKELNQCELFVINLKNGIVEKKVISLNEISKFYNVSFEHVRNSIDRMLKNIGLPLLHYHNYREKDFGTVNISRNK